MARNAILESSNDVAVSIVSMWEIGLKVATGKLPLESDVLAFIQRTQADGIAIIPIPLTAPFTISHMPFYHNDPFDRMIVATALLDNYSIVSPDTAFDQYNVMRLW